MTLIYYAGSVWWTWPAWLMWGLIGVVVVTSPISWYFDERKRSREKAAQAYPATQ